MGLLSWFRHETRGGSLDAAFDRIANSQKLVSSVQCVGGDVILAILCHVLRV